MKFVGFFKDERLSKPERTVYAIVVTDDVLDDITGVVYTHRFTYILANHGLLLKSFIGKDVDLTLVKSPTLNKDVCTGIRVHAHTHACARDILE